jgi:protein-S-isoprenylcysteine O-methyltransferase Ste14
MEMRSIDFAMPAWIETLELVLKWLGAIAGLGTLFYSLYNMLLAQSRPTGITTGHAKQILRSPYLVIATILFVIAGYVLWIPLPFQLRWQMRLVTLLVGAVVFFSCLLIYIWGLRTLGVNFNASSGFGVRLHKSHQLITDGPYVYIRHPMYLAVILVGWGGLLLYLTWTMLGFAVIMLGLIYRAHKEEEALSKEFSHEWEDYKRRVPGWIPRPSSFRK